MVNLVQKEINSLPVGAVEKVKQYLENSIADNTKRAYLKDWQDFSGWCEGRGLNPWQVTKEVLAIYLTELAEKAKYSTIKRRVTAINQILASKGLSSPAKSPEIRHLLAGIARAKGIAQEGKAPVLTEDLIKMVSFCQDNIKGVRDRALLLLGFTGAFRRSELVGFNVGDLEFTKDGLVVTLRKSKTDQEGQGYKKGIPYGSRPLTCPVRAVKEWLELAGIENKPESPLFMPVTKGGEIKRERLSDKAVALIVKDYCKLAGLDYKKYSGHSLRAGLATSSALAGVPERIIQKQTGHKSLAMLRRYIRDGELFNENPVFKLGL